MIDDVNPPVAATPAVPAKAGVSPQIVAVLRGVGLTVLSAVILAVINYFSTLTSGQMAAIAPIIVFVARSLEGTVDKLRGQLPQQSVAGSHPVLPGEAQV